MEGQDLVKLVGVVGGENEEGELRDCWLKSPHPDLKHASSIRPGRDCGP